MRQVHLKITYHIYSNKRPYSNKCSPPQRFVTFFNVFLCISMYFYVFLCIFMYFYVFYVFLCIFYVFLSRLNLFRKRDYAITMCVCVCVCMFMYVCDILVKVLKKWSQMKSLSPITTKLGW